MSRKDKIGFWAVFGIVTGSQIGSAVFTLPTCLAPYGIFGLFGTLISGIGAMFLCMVFAILCSKLPYTGGSHIYMKNAFGEKLAFFGGWTYWLISWVSTTVVVITSVGYLSPFLHKLFGSNIFFINYNREIYLFLELFILFSIAWLNLKGIKCAGNAEFLLTLLKFIPLIILPILALCYFKLSNFQIDPSFAKFSNLQLSAKATLLSLWGFIGLETGTTPADSVIRPEVTIPKATIFGTLSVALLYMLNFVGTLGVIPNKQLMYSNAPYVDLAQLIFNGNGYLLISLVASVVCIGTLNAWILASSQISLGLAKDGLMPKIFKVLNKNEVPVYGVLINCLGMVPILILIFSNSFAQQINKILDISVIAFLFVYTMCVLSLLKILYKEKNKNLYYYLIAVISLVFCVWVIYETEIKTLLLASLFILSGVPIYWLRYYFKTKKLEF